MMSSSNELEKCTRESITIDPIKAPFTLKPLEACCDKFVGHFEDTIQGVILSFPGLKIWTRTWVQVT